MPQQALIAGGGIGGLAAALAGARAGWDVRLYERASVFSDDGAGIQLGPNVVKVLHGWGLADALADVAAFPDRLEVRSAVSGETLGVLRLGDVMAQRYGAPYATVHRADLHGLLLGAVQQAGVVLKLNHNLSSFTQNLEAVTVQSGDDPSVEGDVLVGADYRNQLSDQSYSSVSIYGPYTSPTLSDDSVKVNQFGAYTSIVVKDLAGFNVELGGRYNNFNKYGNVFTFSFNPSYVIKNSIKIFGNISSGFKAPSLYQVYSEYRIPAGELKPEKSFTTIDV